MQEIKFKPELIEMIECGKKTATTRLGMKTQYNLGEVCMVNADDKDDTMLGYTITSLRYATFGQLDKKLALKEGYTKVSELRKALVNIYGQIDDNYTMTVIDFEESHGD